MKTFFRFFAPLSLVCLTIAFTPKAGAQHVFGYDGVDAPSPQIPTKPQTYGERVGEKAASSFANIATGWLEMPKNIINTTNQSNIVYGFVGGLAKGIIHMGGRMGTGIADLVTLPIPTKPILYPLYIWDDFDVDTNYGDVMRLQALKRKSAQAQQPPAPKIATPVAQAMPAPLPQPVRNSADTNRKIDAIFKKEMMK